jgi:hypothetical protein
MNLGTIVPLSLFSRKRFYAREKKTKKVANATFLPSRAARRVCVNAVDTIILFFQARFDEGLEQRVRLCGAGLAFGVELNG